MHCLNSYTLLEGKEATFSSPGKHKATIETESLVSCKLQSNRFLRNKCYAMSTMEWQGLEHALECFVLKFDGAVKIICRDQRVLCSTIVRSKPRKKGFPRDVSERPPPDLDQSVQLLTELSTVKVLK